MYFLKLTLQFLEKEKVNKGRLSKKRQSQPAQQGLHCRLPWSYIVLNAIEELMLGSGQSTLPAVFTH